MKSFVPPFAILCTLAVVGCGNDPREPYVIADWQMRCDSEMGMCAVPLARSVTGENGEGNQTVSCVVTETDDARTISVTAGGLAADGTRFQLQISSARVSRAGGFVGGSSCSLRVTEGSNRYSGTCGGAAPTAEQPCQVEVRFRYDEDIMTPVATVSVFCDHLPNEATAEQLRSLTSHISASEPADLEFYHCVGLTAD